MNALLIITWICAAMAALSFVEAYVEGRNCWDRKKLGWKLKLPEGYKFSGYHFFLFIVMLPLFLSLPLAVYGWNTELFGILLSGFFIGLVVEDFVYFLVNPAIKFREFFSKLTDFYPWIKIRNRKIIPWGYVLGIALAVLSWYLFWR